jgi:hypothetical protein
MDKEQHAETRRICGDDVADGESDAVHQKADSK